MFLIAVTMSFEFVRLQAGTVVGAGKGAIQREVFFYYACAQCRRRHRDAGARCMIGIAKFGAKDLPASPSARRFTSLRGVGYSVLP